MTSGTLIKLWNTTELADELGIHRVSMVTWLRNRPMLIPGVTLVFGNRTVKLWTAAQVEEIRRMRDG